MSDYRDLVKKRAHSGSFSLSESYQSACSSEVREPTEEDLLKLQNLQQGLAELQALDYKELLKKYIAHVIEFNEADYLGYCGPNGLGYFSQVELDELYRMSNEARDD